VFARAATTALTYPPHSSKPSAYSALDDGKAPYPGQHFGVIVNNESLVRAFALRCLGLGRLTDNKTRWQWAEDTVVRRMAGLVLGARGCR